MEIDAQGSQVGQQSQVSKQQAGDEQLAGTVKLHRRHVVVLTDQADWPSHIDQAVGLPATLLAAVAGHSDRLGDVKVTAATGNTAARGHEVLVFPDMVRYRGVGADHPDADIAALVEDHLLGGSVSTRLVSEPLTGHHLFVCVHAARDQRCGDQGPELAAAVERELRARGIEDATVRRSSHVGGHRYAGCLIAYPAGDWYGMLTSDLAPRIVDQCVARNRMLADHWRGRLGMAPAVQLETATELALT